MITSAVCQSYLRDIFTGMHMSADVYMIALYASSARLDAGTQRYTADGEVTGAGYRAGGIALDGFAARLSDVGASLLFSDATWQAATITARGALVYNASRDGLAVAVLDFGADIASTSGEFRVTFPASGVIKLT